MLVSRRSMLAAALLLLGFPAAPTAVAQGDAYPSRPIQLIVTVPPGGAADLTARLVGAEMAKGLGQSVVVQNKGGASGTIATDFVAKAKPDGYTLLLNAISTHGIGPHLFAKLPYDPVKDFAPIGLVASIPLVLVVHADVKATSVAELIALAKATPGRVSFATPGKGGAPHMAAELFMQATGTEMLHVPYKGSGPAVIDLAEGRVHIMFDGVPALDPHIRSGKLRPIAANSAKRNAVLADVPTFAELGMPGMEVSLWYGLVAPAGTPQPVLERLNGELAKALASAAVREGFARQSIEPGGGSADDFARFMAAESARWARVVKAARIEPE